MDWITKLEEWGYPHDKAALASALENLNLRPEQFKTPLQLASVIAQQRQREPSIASFEWWDPLQQFLQWVWEQIKPWITDIGLIALGGFITWWASGWYRAIGAVPMVLGLYRILVRTGVIQPLW